MRFGLRVVAILSFLLGVFVPASALDPRSALTQYGVTSWADEGSLPSLAINDVLQSSDGYLWIASDSGLVRFDGYRFVTYTKSNSGLAANNVLSLWEDSQHVLWVGLSGGGACRMIEARFHCLGEQDGLPKGSVRAIRSDPHGAVWLAAVGAGLIRIQDGKLQQFTKKDGLASDNVTTVFVARDGTVWAGTYDAGASFLQNGRFHSIRKPVLPSNLVWSIAEDKAGSVWLATFEGLCRLQGTADSKSTVYTERNGLPNSNVTRVHVDARGELWVSTEDGGVSRLEGKRFTSLTQEDGLADRSIAAIADDREGDLWLGTKGGLSRLRDQTFAVVGKRQGLPEDAVRIAFEDHSGSLWLGLVNNGVERVSKLKGPLELHPEHIPACSPLAGYEDRKQTIWLGCAGGTILEDKLGKIQRFSLSTPSKFIEVNAIAETPDGHIVAATFGAGLAELVDGVWKTHAVFPNIDHFTSLLPQKEGLWIAALQDGLYEISSNGTVISYSEEFKNIEIYRINGDSDGSVWVESDHGLAHIFGRDVKWIPLDNTPLKDQNLYNLLDDRLGSYWISSDHGVYRLSRSYLLTSSGRSPEPNELSVFGKADGLRAVNYEGFAQPTALRLRDGTICFASSKGLLYTDPAHIDGRVKAPAPMIEEILADDRLINLDERGDVRIPPNRHRIQVSFTGIQLSKPEKLRFFYRLAGVDPNWILSGTNRTVTYTNVSPGTYEFEVRSSFGEGGTPGSVARVTLNVRPVFYQTLWFKTICVTALLLLVVFCYRWQIKRVKRVAAALEAVRTEEQRKSAAQRTAELARASRALQSTIEALDEAATLDRIVARVLEIAAEVFSTTSCAFFENDSSGQVFLRYWNVNGRTLLPAELIQLDPEKFGLVRSLAEGFKTPDSYLGIPTHAIGTVVLDHVRGTSVPEFDRFAVATGWDLELNIGVGAAGLRSSTLCIFRERTKPFTLDEMALAESLAKQLGLSVQFARLADETREAAVAREREEAAQRRAIELVRANRALQATADALAATQKIEEMIPAVLRIISATFDSRATGYFEFAQDGLIFLRFYLIGDQVFSARELIKRPDLQMYDGFRNLEQGFTIDDRYLGEPLMTRTRSTIVNHEAGTSVPAFDAWAKENDWAMELNVPLVVDSHPFAALTLAREADRPYTEVEIELAEALAKQFALAVQASRIASESERRAVAVARAKEQEEAARLRANELVEINSQLRDDLAKLLEGKDAQETLKHILSSALRQLQAEGACIFALSESQQTLQIAASADKTMLADDALLNRLGRCTDPFPVASLPLWKHLMATRESIVLDVRIDEDAKWLRAGARQWHLEHLRPVIIAVPLAVAGRLLGYLSITFGPEISTQAVSAEHLRMAQSLASLAAMTIETDRLAKRAQDAAIAEDRNRLAQELHDTLAGAFTGIFMQVQAASELAESEREQRRACIARAEDLARNGLRQVREFVHSLTVIGEDRWKSVEVMRKIVSDATSATGTAGIFAVLGTEQLLKATVAHALQRILQEAVGNAQRYANATKVETTLFFEEESVRMTIRDDGDGFDVRSVSDSGFGIPGMRTRVARLAGAFSIDSAPGRGTTISVRLPEPYEVPLR